MCRESKIVYIFLFIKAYSILNAASLCILNLVTYFGGQARFV